jgi:superfamily II DNA or RNA helicase
MNIDDIADDKTDQASPGERFHEEWLADLPISQWAPYIDESAQLVADGIFIGETDLTKADFPFETGDFYRQGLAETADIDPRETALPLGQYSARDVGAVAWTFNQLREEIRNSKYTDYENPSRAIEAAINKLLVEKVETNQLDTDELETIRLPESASVSTLVSEVFCRPRSETYVNLLLETIGQSQTSGLLERIEEPRMVTPLWDHQREALDEWLVHDCRGYVDMATATGKTFLGLAAIAHHFGNLHPADRDLIDSRFRHSGSRRATVVVVAHRDLILDQWKREFDTHLNIPEESGTESGEHTAHFEWGDVHFWTPNRLQQADLLEDTDLVVLDETHHYLGSSGFGSLLDEIDGHILALSGSIDESNARTLERRNIPKLFEFSLRDGQRAGIIPQCEWDVVFTPYENQSRLAETTAKCAAGTQRYADGIPVPDTVDADTTTLTFENLSEARSLAQSSLGRELKEHDPDFREFASAVQARQLTTYNLSPTLSTVVHLVVDNIDHHKCVVLLETKDEVAKVTSKLKSRLGDSYESLVTVLEDPSDLSAVERFDRNRNNGAIVGLANTLGEGIDIETADVCINRGRGRLSRSLVQRMGRILRNPEGDKEARFFHVSGIPIWEDALLPDEDGVALLETASQMLDWGDGFNARPVFTIDTETDLTGERLSEIETAGATAIDEWSPDHYEWPQDDGVRDQLGELCTKVSSQDQSALLAIERGDDAQSTDDTRDIEEKTGISDGMAFVAADNGSVEIAEWLYDLISASVDDIDTFVETAVRDYLQETFVYPEADDLPEVKQEIEISINPALEATLSVYNEDGSKKAAVHAAIAQAIDDDPEDVLDESDVTASMEMMRTALSSLGERNE